MSSHFVRCVAIALLAQLWQASALAQERYEVADVVRANLEPSYLVVPLELGGLDPVWYEANVVAHFVVHRQAWPFSLVLTPKVIARLFQAYSEPVKTPSYMPRLALFYWLDAPDAQSGAVRYASFTVMHHSNGQAGSTYLPGRRGLNHDTGDFYTNGIELAVHLFEPALPVFRWSRAALEWDPWLVQQEDIAGRYGSLHLQLDATVLQQPSFGGSLSASLGALLDAFAHNEQGSVARLLERFQLSIAYAVAFEGSDLALFARYYGGRDYYNIWFDRNVHVLQLGIASHVAPLLGGKP